MKLKLILLSIVVICFIALAGCQPQTNPFFKDARAEPTFVVPNHEAKKSADIVYEISNPTNIDFAGKTNLVYDTECFTVYPPSQEVEIPAKDARGYSISITAQSTNRRGDLPDNCYKTQAILIDLTNEGGDILYDAKEIEITITHR